MFMRELSIKEALIGGALLGLGAAAIGTLAFLFTSVISYGVILGGVCAGIAALGAPVVAAFFTGSRDMMGNTHHNPTPLVTLAASVLATSLIAGVAISKAAQHAPTAGTPFNDASQNGSKPPAVRITNGRPGITR